MICLYYISLHFSVIFLSITVLHLPAFLCDLSPLHLPAFLCDLSLLHLPAFLCDLSLLHLLAFLCDLSLLHLSAFLRDLSLLQCLIYLPFSPISLPLLPDISPPSSVESLNTCQLPLIEVLPSQISDWGSTPGAYYLKMLLKGGGGQIGGSTPGMLEMLLKGEGVRLG